MIRKALLAGTIAAGLIVPAKAGVYLPPKPAIVKPENIEFSKNLLAMPFTLGMLPSRSLPLLAFGNTANYTTSTTSTTSHVVSLPTGYAAGDLLLIMFVVHSSTATTPSGWTLVDTNGVNSNSDNAYIFAKLATGSEGSSVTITTSASNLASGISVAITGARSSLTGMIEFAKLATTSTSLTPNPPSLTPTWGSARNIWIAVAFSQDGNYTFSSYPTNYTDKQAIQQTGGFPGNSVIMAGRILSASTEDPGVFTTTANARVWTTYTLAIRPQ